MIEQKEEIIRILKSIGLRETTAGILLYFLEKQHCVFAKDIIRDLNMLQPTVSMSVATLIDLKLLSAKTMVNNVRGRPSIQYSADYGEIEKFCTERLGEKIKKLKDDAELLNLVALQMENGRKNDGETGTP